MKNLFLIGYRGTGKTVIGKEIAKSLKMNFADIDLLIVELTKKTIPQIFESEGQEKFRDYETSALDSVSKKENQIISCGGGIITKERNFKLLKTGVVCLLNSDPKTIFNRIYNDKNRPPLTNKDPFEEIVHMLEQRKELYNKAKDFEINTSKMSVRDCAKLIIEKYNELTIKN
jgi:shikimate kinase